MEDPADIVVDIAEIISKQTFHSVFFGWIAEGPLHSFKYHTQRLHI